DRLETATATSARGRTAARMSGREIDRRRKRRVQKSFSAARPAPDRSAQARWFPGEAKPADATRRSLYSSDLPNFLARRAAFLYNLKHQTGARTLEPLS